MALFPSRAQQLKMICAATILLVAGTAMSGPASAADVIRFGAPLPITGPLSPEAQKQQRGYNLWAEMANNAGGIKVGDKHFKVEIDYVDYQSNTPRAVQAAERLITQDKVNFLFAPFGSGATKAASSVSERYKIPMVAATASSAQVYDQGYKYLFGIFTPNETLTNPVADIVTKKFPSTRTIAILARNDLFPLAIAQEMEKSAKRDKLDVVFFQKYDIGTLDFASPLTEIKAKKPDWIFATGYTNDLVLMRKQMGDLQIKASFVTMIAAPAYQEFIDSTGKLSENVTSASWWHPAERYKGVDIFGSTENFVKAWQAKYNTLPDYGEASAAASGAIYQLAIERAGSIEPQKVRDALAAMDLTTFWGPVHFAADGQIDSLKPPVFQIQNGKAVVIFPDAIKQGELLSGVN